MIPHRKGQDELSGMVAILQDRVLALEDALRRFKQRENDARDSEELLRSTLDAVPDLIAILGNEHQILRVNRAMAERLGATPDRCVGLKCYAAVHGTDAPPSFCPHARLLETGQEQTAEVHEDHLRGDFLVTCSPLRDGDGTLIGSVHVARDITERKQAQRTLEWDDALLRSIREAQSLYIEGADPRQVFGRLLDTLVSMTRSEYGFLDEVVYDVEGNSYKRSLALSNIAWDEGSRRLYEQLVGSNMEFRNLQNLAGAPAIGGRLVIANDVPHDPRSGGLPEGHPSLNSFMGIPMHYAGELVGVAGVANRPGGYDEHLADALEPFIRTCAGIVHAVRNERKERAFAEAQKAGETRFRDIVNNVADLIWEVDDRLIFTYCSEHVREVLGFAVQEMIGRSLFDCIVPEDRPEQEAAFEQVARRRGSFRDREVTLLHKDGRRLIFQISGVPILGQDGAFLGYRGVNRDVTRAKWAQREEGLTLELLGLLTSKTNLHDLMADVTALLSRWAGCEAVGIRLRQDDDYPYFEIRGFPSEFVELENRLCVVDQAGKPVRDSKGDPVLECMCGNIIYGRFDPSLPFFTRFGSFWSNCTTDLLATTTEEQRQARTRNRCNGMGYESVALIPLRVGQTPLGLLQLNDKQKDRFTLELIELLERQASRIALAIAQRQAEENLRRSETALRAILNSATDTAVLVDSDYRFVACNETAAARVGLSPDAMVGRELLSFFPPEVASRRKVFLDQVRATRQPVRFVDERAGLILDNSYHPVLDQNGDVSRIAIFARDITEQRKAEESLRQSQERHQETSQLLTSVLENTYMMAAYLDTQFNFIWVNKAYAATCGHEPAFFPGKNHFDLYPHAENQAIFQRVVDTGEPCFVAARPFVFPDQPERGVTYWDWSLFPVKTGANKLVGLVFTLADVTDRIRAQQSLRVSEERFRAFMDNSPAIAWAKDDQGRHVYLSRTYERRFGVRLDDWRGKTDADLWPPEIARVFRENDLKVLNSGEPTEVFEHTTNPDGSLCHWLNFKFPFQDGEGRRYIGGIGMDITDRKKAEETLRESEEKYRQLVETATEGVWAMDVERRTTFVNQRMAEMLGLTVDDMAGRRVTDFMFPEDLSAHQDRMKERREGHEGRYEQRFRRSDGSAVWCLVSARPLKDDQGRFAGSFGMFTDITERKQAEENLHRSLRRFELLTRTAEMLLRTDQPQEMVETLCRQVMDLLDCQAFFNFLADDLAGCLHLNACAGIPPEEAKKIEWLEYGVAVCGCAARDACRIVTEHIPSTADPRTELVKSYGIKAYACHPLLGVGGKVIGTLSFGTRNRETFSEEDLSLMKAVADQVAMAMMRMESQKSVYESEQRHRYLFENMLNGLAYCRMLFEDGRPVDFVYLAVNNAFEMLTGLKDVVGKRVSEVIPGIRESDPGLLEAYGRVALTGKGERFEVYLKALDMWFSLSVYSPKKEHFVAAFEVITERKRSEERLRRTSERLHMAQLAAGAGAWDWDISTGHIEWTPELFTLFGLDPKVHPASLETWRAVVHPEDRDIASRRIEEAIRDRKPLVNEYRIVRPDGTVRWISAFGDTTYDDAGRPLRMAGICIDATDRKQSEGALRQSEEKYRTLVDQAADAIFLHDLSGRILDVNRKACENLGYTREELLSKSVADIDPEAIQARHHESWGQIPLGRQVRFESRQRRKDGSFFPVEVILGSVNLASGLAVLGIVRDITDRKLVEDALSKSEEAARAILDASTAAVTLLDRRGTILDCNEEQASRFHLRREEILGRCVWDLLPKAVAEQRKRIAERVFQAGRMLRMEDEREGMWNDVVVYPVIGEAGGVERVAMHAMNITDRKRAELALRRASLYSRNLLETSLDPLVTISAEGKITDVNSATEKITGVGRDKLIGSDFADYFTDPDMARAGYRKAFTEGQVIDYPLAVRHTSGGTADVLYNASVYRNEKGEVLGVFAAARDITGRKQAENALKASLAEKEVLLREVHHRVKNNLAAIAALLEIQQKAVGDEAATDALNDLAGRIKSMSLVHERLYRSENISRIDLRDYIEALVSHIRTSFGSKSALSCEVRASGVEMGLDAAIPCGLIINELVTNAIKYAFPGGKSCPGATDCRIEVSLSQAGAAYTLVVADNGVGLPPDLDWTTTSSLGLRLVRMVGQHQLGGHIELDRSAGTRFTLTFGSDQAG